MRREDILEVIAEGESETLELKKSTAELVDGMRSLCAMANGKGGMLIFGVLPETTRSASDRAVGQSVSDGTLRDLAAELRKFEPPLHCDLHRIPTDGDRQLMVIVVPGGGGPFVYDGRAYRKLGSTKDRMPQDQYERLLFERRHGANRWELGVAANVRMSDLDLDEIDMTLEEAIRRGRMVDPGTREPWRVLEGLGLLQQGKPLNAAVVLFGRESALVANYPQCVLRLARFRSTIKHDFIDNRQQLGNAFVLYRAAQRFMIEHLPIAGRIMPGIFERHDDPQYPPEALREALANAIIHRDYTTAGGSVSLAIYQDRLEVTSVGPLPFGQKAEDLLRPHPSRPWNPLIAKVFYLRGLIETWGRGTNRIQQLVEESGSSTADFIATKHDVTVVFKPSVTNATALASGATSISGPESRLESGPESGPESLATRLLLAIRKVPLSRSEIARTLGHQSVSGSLNRHIKVLLSEGKIERTIPEKPQSRNQKYRITEKGKQALEPGMISGE